MTVRWVRATTPGFCWGGDRPTQPGSEAPGEEGKFTTQGDAGTHAEVCSPARYGRRPPPDPGRSAPSAAPRTQQRPQVLPAGGSTRPS